MDGDIWVSLGIPICFVDSSLVGVKIHEHIACPAFASIYRKMKCPDSASCDDTTGWKARQEELLRNPGKMEWHNEANDKAKTYDDGKPPLAYLPWAGIDEVAQVQAYGHRKYNDFYNYRKGMEIGRNLSCAIRHIRAFMEGEDLDQESNRSHLAHAACRLLFVMQNIHDKTVIDDRFKKGTK